MRLSTTLRNEVLEVLSQVEGGTATFYDGALPTNIGDTPAGNNLGSVTIPNPGFNAAASGQMTLTGTWSGTATAAAGAGTTPTFALLTNGARTMLLTTSLSGGGGELIVDAAFEENGVINVTGITLTMPGA